MQLYVHKVPVPPISWKVNHCSRKKTQDAWAWLNGHRGPGSAASPAQSVSASGDRELWPQVFMKWALGRRHLVPFSPDKLSPSLAATQDERKEGCPTAISGAWHATFSPEERSCEPEGLQQQRRDWENNREAHPKSQCHCPVWLASQEQIQRNHVLGPTTAPMLSSWMGHERIKGRGGQ